MGDSFIFDDKYSMLCLFIERNLFFSHHVYTCRRWERKYYDIVSCDVCDGLIGNRSESTKLPFETQVIVDEHRLTRTAAARLSYNLDKGVKQTI